MTTSADLQKAAHIVINAKTSRPSVCNALDTILIDASVAAAFLPMISKGMSAFDVEIFADDQAYQILNDANYPTLKHANQDDFGREFLDYKCSVKVVSGFEEALAHIRHFSSKHSEAIISEDTQLCERFLRSVDAAAVYANAFHPLYRWRCFLDWEQKSAFPPKNYMHEARLHWKKLVTEKWIVRGNGQIR